MAECSPEANRGYREGSRGSRQEAQCDGLQGGVGSRSTSSGGSEGNRGSSQGRGERVTAGCRVCSRLAKAGPGGTLVCTDGAVESWRLAVGVSLIVRAQPPTLFFGGQVLGVPASETRRRHKRCKAQGQRRLLRARVQLSNWAGLGPTRRQQGRIKEKAG